MADRIDRVLSFAKWPAALLSLALFPAAALAFLDRTSVFGNRVMWPFLGGLFGYALLWTVLLRRPAWGSLISTFEHELTHALFAWLTLHRVTGLVASWQGGGHVDFSGGRGNWLITIAPYFFPTVSVAIACTRAVVPAAHADLFMGFFGVTVGYHAMSTLHEIHRRQTDLEDTGWAFALAFLPAANLLAYGLLIAFASDGLGGLLEHLRECQSLARETFADLMRSPF